MNAILIFAIVMLLVFVLLWYISAQNKLMRKKNDVHHAEGSINTMIKKRHDLIPNLVKIAQTQMEHEKQIFSEIKQLSTHMQEQLLLEEQVELDNRISIQMNNAIQAVKPSGSLGSKKSIMHLQQSWQEVEDQISASRRFYNSAVTEYNTLIDSFPYSRFAKKLGLEKKNIIRTTLKEKMYPTEQDGFQNNQIR